jgi:hypothetical protein
LGGLLGDLPGRNLSADSARPAEHDVKAYKNPNAVLDDATDELTSWHWT